MLLTEVSEIKRFVAINLTVSNTTMLPYIVLAERRHLIPILGRPLYNSLLALYESSASSSSSATIKLEALLEEVQWALSYLSVYEFLVHIAGVQITDGGVSEANDEGLKAARKWVTDEVKASHKHTAFEQLDQLLLFLEKNKDDYPTWVSDGNYTQYTDCLLYSTSIMEQYYPIGGSRRVFLALKPFVKRAENEYIKPVLGASLYAALLADLQTGTPTVLNKALIAYVQQASVYVTLQLGVPSLAVKITERGLTLDSTDTIHEDNTIIAQAGAEKVGPFITYINKQAGNTLTQLRNYLETNKTSYPLYVPFVRENPNQAERKNWVF